MPLFDERCRYLNLYGSAGSGKSIFASQKLLRRACEESGHKFLVIRKVASTIKDSVFSEIQSRIFEWGLEYHVRINKTDKTFFFDNGSSIICKGLDEPEKMKSIEGVTGTWMEEATELDEEDFDQIILRVRGEKKHYVQHITSFNPIDENHWLKRRMVDDVAWGNNQVKLFKSTFLDNAFIDEEYAQHLALLEKSNPLYYQVYCLGEWGIVDTSNKFLFNFDYHRHVAPVGHDDSIVVRLSFDFNIDPFCVVVYQRHGDALHIIDTISMSNSDIEQVCDRILTRYGRQKYIVTGDVSGKSRAGHVRGKKTYWGVIKDRLKLADYQIRLRSRNLDLLESRILCNYILEHLDVKINRDMKQLITECQYARVDDHGILLKDRKANKNDMIDCLRYALDSEFPDAIVRPKKYEKRLVA
jgi:phage terminase large subunit